MTQQPTMKDSEALGQFPWYRRRWCHPEIGPELRRRYNDDWDAYRSVKLHKLRWTDSELRHFQEQGMEYFAKLEFRMARQARSNDFKRIGRRALNAFVNAASTEDRTFAGDADCVFASIDFEGHENSPFGIHGYGVATLDTRAILTREDDPSINAQNFRLAKHNQNFGYGHTKRIEHEDFQSTIIDTLTPRSEDGNIRKVVLVGHGLHSEFARFKSLNIDIERDLPNIIGIIDTFEIGQEYFAQVRSLKSLVDWLGIPHRWHFFHNAGNDAMLTLQSLLALMYRRSKRLSAGWPALELHDLAYRPLCDPGKHYATGNEWEFDLVGDGDCGIELWS